MCVQPPTLPTSRRIAPPTRQRGQGLLEFALILPLLLLFVLGVIEAGRMLAIYSSLSSAAQQAARYGSVAGDSDTSTSGEQPLYLDCIGMKAAAQRSSLLVGLGSGDINISYDRGTTAEPIGACGLDAASPTLSETIQDGYRVIISITAVYQPIVPIVPLPDLPITFAVARTIFTTIIGPTATPPANPDMLIAKRGAPLVVSPDGVLTYWITATNNLTSGVIGTNIAITDTLPLSATLSQGDLDDILDDYNWNCVFLVQSPPPQQIRCSRVAPLVPGQSSGFSYAVQAPLFGGVTLTNTVEIGSAKVDVQPSNNLTYTVHPVLPGADLQPFKSVTPTGAIGGGSLLTYTLWVRNNGGDVSDTKASSGDYIWITDTLPSGVAPYKSLTAGSGWTCLTLFTPDRIACRYAQDLATGADSTLVTLVITAPTTAGTLTNSVVVTPSLLTADPLPLNNSASVSSLVVTDADLSLTKLGAATAIDGGNLLYTLRATNLGPSVATNVRITDTVPGTIQSVTPGPGWSCSTVGNTVSCVRAATLAVGATTADIAIAITVPAQDIVNTAVTGSSMPDPTTANNAATVTTTVTICNAGRTHNPFSIVTAAPAAVQADGTTVSKITVRLLDLCGNPATHSQTVSLTSSRGVSDTITLAAGSSNPTTSGTVVFDVKSLWPGTSQYSASAQNHVVAETINLDATASVTYYGCMTLIGQGNQATTQTYVDFRMTNGTDRAWKLTNLSIDWPASGGRKINQIVMGTAPATTLWSGNSGSDPFSLPGSAAWNGGTDAARTIAVGVIGQSLLFHFSFATPGQLYSLAATWDDGNGNTCTTLSTVTP